MTSNLGSHLWEGGREAGREEIMQTLQAHFRPEFLNRIDEIVTFHALNREHLVEIVDIQLERVRKLLADQGYKLEVTEQAKQFLADVGYNPQFGARPLKRAIQRELQDPLALKILSGDFHEGETIFVDHGQDELTFTPLVEAELVDEGQGEAVPA
jgi:ATP-dependent Clp protease ATP-binding subunit ClpB